jgi:hypothetical protein
MLKRITNTLKGLNPWHYVWISIVISEIITNTINILYGYVWRGSISHELMFICAIDAFVVPAVAAPLAIYFILAYRKQMDRKRERLISELRAALARIKTLKGLIPVCAWCRKVRNDEGYWDILENYVRANSEVDFTHGICPECLHRLEGDTQRK